MIYLFLLSILIKNLLQVLLILLIAGVQVDDNGLTGFHSELFLNSGSNTA